MSKPGIIQQSFRINILIMSICHLYPPEKQSTIHKLQSYLLYILYVLVVPALGILYVLLTDNLDMQRVSYAAGFLVQTSFFVIKLFPFVKNGRRIRNCINFFDSPVVDMTKEEHQRVVNECIGICRRNTRYFLGSSIVAASHWAAEPIFGKKRKLPVDMWLPYNATENRVVFMCVYVYAVVAVYIVSLAVSSVDPLIGGLVYHATTQVRILKNNLEHLSDSADKDVAKHKVRDESEGSWLKHKIIYNKICESVYHYEFIQEFVKEYEACFSWSVFSQFASSVFVICFICVQLSETSPTDIHFIQNVLYICVVLLQIYFYCYYGSTLASESDNLTNAIYMSKWYEFDNRSKNALITIMQRSQKPMILTAGKVVDMSLVTFASILRKSYSLVAVLKNFE